MSALIRLCFRRPVTVTAFYVLMFVLAGVAVIRLPVALLPDLRYPALAVWTAYPDVPPERVERAVTERIEEAVAGTEGLRRITSRSLLGGSLVRMDFGWNTDLNWALLNVREQIDRLGEALPDATERPIVLRLDPSDRPIMMIALRGKETKGRDSNKEARETPPDPNNPQFPVSPSPHRSDPQTLIERKRLGREVIARRLEQLGDIARVRVTGGHDRRIEIRIDPARLATYRIGIDGIAHALRGANVALPGGMIRRGPFRYAVEISGEFRGIDDIAGTVIARVGETSIRLQDVAEVYEGVAERRGLVRLDGDETLLLLVERRPDANTVRAAREVRRVLGEMETELSGITLDVVVDESAFIEQAIGGVTQALWLGGMLAVLILLLFLRRPRLLLAVAIAVPLSLALTLILFDMLGVTFNLISLSGLALGIGMLVDNAIVVVENITRLREQGQTPLEAARNGVLEVAGAITASTLTTIAVFLPITLVEGLAGRLFRDQSLAVVCSLLASLLVALTVVPLIARRAFSDSPSPRFPASPITSLVAGACTRLRPGASFPQFPDSPSPQRSISQTLRIYETALAWCLDRRRYILLGCALLLMLTAWIGWHLPREVIPQTDQGRLEVHLSLPADTDLNLIDIRAEALSAQIRQQMPVRHILADLGERDEARLDLDPRPPYEGTLILLLPETTGDGTSSAGTVQSALHNLKIPNDLHIEVKPIRTQLEALLTSEDADLLIDLVSERRHETESALDPLLMALRNAPELTNVRRADVAEVPAYRLTLNREALSRFRVAPETITAYLEAAARGRHATELRTVNEDVPIVIRSVEIASMEDLLAQQVPAPTGLLPLGMFVEAEAVTLPAALMRVEQAPVVRLLADVPPTSDLVAATGRITTTFSEVLPASVRGQVHGANEAFMAGLQALGWSLLLSVLLVYLILAAQFESLVQPLIILATVPLAGAGVVLVLYITGHSLNLMSLTGCVVLVGIVVNDAILKVDFINQRRAAGMPLRKAILEAGHDRFRPIVMTTLTTVLGLLPLTLGFGQGAELRAPLAIAIAGGLSLATLLTLFVVPVLYAGIVRDRDTGRSVIG